MTTTTTHAEAGSETAAASGYHLEITVGDKTHSQLELKASESLVIRARAGEQYRVISGEGDSLPDSVVAIRTDNDLEIRFDSGINLVIEDYHLVCSEDQCGIRFSAEGIPLNAEDFDEPSSGNSTVQIISWRSSDVVNADNDLAESDLLVESQGNQTQSETSNSVVEGEGMSLGMMSLGVAGLGLLVGAASRSSSGSSTPNINPELTAPTTTIAIDSISDDTGSSDFIANDHDGLTVAATLSAALADGETLEYSSDNGETFTDITSFSVNGTAISHVDSSLTSTSTIQFRVTDAASNSGAVASQLVTMIDLLNDGGNSNIVLNLTDVLNLGESSTNNPLVDLVIAGDSGDTVTLDNDSNAQRGSWEEGDTFSGVVSYEFVGLGNEVFAIVQINQGQGMQMDVMAVI